MYKRRKNLLTTVKRPKKKSKQRNTSMKNYKLLKIQTCKTKKSKRIIIQIYVQTYKNTYKCVDKRRSIQKYEQRKKNQSNIETDVQRNVQISIWKK